MDSDRQLQFVQAVDEGVDKYGVESLLKVKGYHSGVLVLVEVGQDGVGDFTQLLGCGVTFPEPELIAVELVSSMWSRLLFRMRRSKILLKVFRREI